MEGMLASIPFVVLLLIYSWLILSWVTLVYPPLPKPTTFPLPSTSSPAGLRSLSRHPAQSKTNTCYERCKTISILFPILIVFDVVVIIGFVAWMYTFYYSIDDNIGVYGTELLVAVIIIFVAFFFIYGCIIRIKVKSPYNSYAKPVVMILFVFSVSFFVSSIIWLSGVTDLRYLTKSTLYDAVYLGIDVANVICIIVILDLEFRSMIADDNSFTFATSSTGSAKQKSNYSEIPASPAYDTKKNTDPSALGSDSTVASNASSSSGGGPNTKQKNKMLSPAQRRKQEQEKKKETMVDSRNEGSVVSNSSVPSVSAQNRKILSPAQRRKLEQEEKQRLKEEQEEKKKHQIVNSEIQSKVDLGGSVDGETGSGNTSTTSSFNTMMGGEQGDSILGADHAHVAMNLLSDSRTSSSNLKESKKNSSDQNDEINLIYPAQIEMGTMSNLGGSKYVGHHQDDSMSGVEPPVSAALRASAVSTTPPSPHSPNTGTTSYMIFKVVYITSRNTEDIRRFRVVLGKPQGFSFLCGMIRQSYGIDMNQFILKYKDTEGDDCAITDELQFQDAIVSSAKEHGESKTIRVVLERASIHAMSTLKQHPVAKQISNDLHDIPPPPPPEPTLLPAIPVPEPIRISKSAPPPVPTYAPTITPAPIMSESVPPPPPPYEPTLTFAPIISLPSLNIPAHTVPISTAPIFPSNTQPSPSIVTTNTTPKITLTFTIPSKSVSPVSAKKV